jgi:hypothetical protein
MYLKKIVRTVPKFNIYIFDYYLWFNTSANGLLVPESIIRPVVCALALAYLWRKSVS